LPYNFFSGAVTKIKNEIYFFGSGASNCYMYAYKYNILTKEHTRLADIPENGIYNGQAVTIDNDIYLIGVRTAKSDTSIYGTSIYKYDILENTYIKLIEMPYYLTGKAALINKDIYLFGGDSITDKYVYKYSILNNVFTKLTDIPFDYDRNGDLVNIDNNVYLFYYFSAYKYNTSTNKYTKLNDIPYDFRYGPAVMISEAREIYLFGGGMTNYEKNIYKYQADSFTNKTIFIETQTLLKINLSKILSVYISNAKISTDQELLSYPVYYGNGKQWIKIEN